MVNRKDALPEETVNKIKMILKGISIIVIEKEYLSVGHNIFSIRLELKDFSLLGVNGKGFSKKLALASAYAELMERLQAGFLIKTYFLNKESNKSIFKDEYLLEYEDFYKKFLNLLKTMYPLNFLKFLELSKENIEYRVCSYFTNLITDEEELLPIKFINLAAQSNGLCSGNTYEESLVQGICEVFERYCYKAILLDDVKVPTIVNENHFVLEELSSLGYLYEIKDCSLGKFPVVGLVIYNKDKSKYLFSIGSDPDFNIALERCITEIFQGLDKEFYSKMKSTNNNYESLNESDKELNWLKNYSSNSGIHPKSVFDNSLIREVQQLPFIDNFSDEKASNKECLEYVKNIIKINNLNLFIKDYSYLGFHTYRVYISGISEVNKIDTFDLELLKKKILLKKIFFNLNEDNTEIDESLKLLNKMYSIKKYSNLIIPEKFFSVSESFVKTDLNKISYLHLLIILLLKYKKYEQLENIIKNSRKIQTSEYKNFLDLIMIFLKKKAITKEHKRLKIFRQTEMLVNNTNQFLEKLLIPSCPNCYKCKCSSFCRYKKWSHIHDLLSDKYEEFINQKYLRKKVFIKSLKPELTECRIIQFEKRDKKNDSL
jgi:ribosomal protein S12 methylthiotransferase accessory factor